MRLAKDRVVVLKSVNFSEADRILTLFGEKLGKFTVIAKGVRKMESKNRGNIQTMCVSRISFFRGQTMGILKEAELLYAPDVTHENIHLLNKALFLFNKVLPEDAPEPELFKLFVQLVAKPIGLIELNRFQIKVLQSLGFIGQINSCSLCGSAQLQLLNVEEFKAYCAKCAETLQSEGANYLPISNLKDNQVQLANAIDRFVQDHVL